MSSSSPEKKKKRKRLQAFSFREILFFFPFFFLFGCQERDEKQRLHTITKPLSIQTADTSLHGCLQIQSASLLGKDYLFQAHNTCPEQLKCNVFLHYSCTTNYKKTAMTFVKIPQIQANQQLFLQKNLQHCKGSIQVLAHRARCMRSL